MFSLLQQIETIYGAHAGDTHLVFKSTNFIERVKELDRCLTVDLIRQIDTKNGNEPYYLDRLISHLDVAMDVSASLAGTAEGDGQRTGTAAEGGEQAAGTARSRRQLEHVCAELQATFVEHGFCQMYEAICGVREAQQKFSVLYEKLDSLDRSLQPRGDPASGRLAIVGVQEALASYNGIRQAMTENDMHMVREYDSKANGRLAALFDCVCSHIRVDSPLFVTYAAAQSLLLKPIVKALFHAPAKQMIDSHLIHSGTRGWLFERLQHWLAVSEKRMFIIAGRPGVGKTAFSAAVCKLFHYNVKAQYFYNEDTNAAADRSVVELVQSISSDLCRTLPEYLNWLDDHCSGRDVADAVRTSWRACYELLLKTPLQSLYGRSKTAPADNTTHAGGGGGDTGRQSVSSLLRDPTAGGSEYTAKPGASHPRGGTGVAGLLRDPDGSDPGEARRQLIVIDGLHHCARAERADLSALLAALGTDLPPAMRLLLTVHQADLTALLPRAETESECVVVEARAFINRHINDIEVYLCSSLGAVLSGELDSMAPDRARADETTLQNTVDELLKSSAGRFDFAIELMESFSYEMGVSGQFLSSVKKAAKPVESRHPADFDRKVGEFASPFRSYRDKEGRNGKTHSCHDAFIRFSFCLRSVTDCLPRNTTD